MQKRLFCSTIFAFFFLLPITAGSPNKISWVEDPYFKISETEYVAAIGVGKTSTDSDRNAATEVARILNQNIESETILSQKATNKSDELSYLSNIKTVSALKEISGLYISDRKTLKDGTCVSRALLKKSDAIRHYSLKFNETEDKINSLISGAEKKSPSIEKCNMLVSAYKLALENDEYKSLLSILNSAIRKIPLYENSSLVLQKTQAAFQEVSVQIIVNGDENERLASAFASTIHQVGFSTSKTNEKSTYILLCNATFKNDGTKQETVFVRYNLETSLKERETSRTILNFSANARKGKLSEQAATQTALRDAEQKIAEDFSQDFLALFESNIN
ncbi:MAG: hypothetical protein J6X84_04425 [Treponema sp.]|nr:hypothetical protein [Treponema sp.]